ncbi:MAG: hypothetical protein LBC02_09300 [Planctomycetaceae bacterium]|jgi:hypothetical protein|nr:hypothetical protein [Planctomycetaceae bacterium]
MRNYPKINITQFSTTSLIARHVNNPYLGTIALDLNRQSLSFKPIANGNNPLRQQTVLRGSQSEF